MELWYSNARKHKQRMFVAWLINLPHDVRGGRYQDEPRAQAKNNFYEVKQSDWFKIGMGLGTANQSALFQHT